MSGENRQASGMSKLSRKHISSVLVAVLLGLFVLLYSTQSGLNWLLPYVKGSLPASVEVGEVSGSLLRGVTIQSVKWHDSEQQLSLTGIYVQCRWMAVLWQRLQCSEITIAELDYHTAEPDKSDESWPQLVDIAIGTTVYIERLSIAQIQSNLALQKRIQALQVDRLLLNEFSLRFDELRAHSNRHIVKVAAQLNPYKQWKHQISVEVVGPEITGSLQSKGTVKEGAEMTVSLTKPYQFKTNSQWRYGQGIYIHSGKIEGQSQRIQWQEQSFNLQHLEGEYELSWPRLTGKLAVAAQLEPVKQMTAKSAFVMADITDWRAAFDAVVSVDGHLSRQQAKQWLRSNLPEQVRSYLPQPNPVATSDNEVPLQADMTVELRREQLNLNATDFKLGNNDGKWQAAAQWEDEGLVPLSVDAQVNSASLQPWLDLDIADIALQGQWHNDRPNDDFSLTTTGKIGHIDVQGLAVQQLDWQGQKSDHFEGRLSAKSANYQQFNLEMPSLSLSGVLAKHSLQFSASGKDNARLQFGFEGQLEEQNWHWHGFKAEVSPNDNSKPLTATANQVNLSQQGVNIEKLCLRVNGSACIDAKVEGSQWHGEFNIQQWPLDDVVTAIQPWWRSPFTSVEGQLEGYGQLQGNGNEIQRFDLQLTGKHLALFDDNVQTVIDNFSIRGNSEQGKKQLIAKWDETSSRFVTEEMEAIVKMPDGTLTVEFDEQYSPHFTLIQPNIVLRRPLLEVGVENEVKVSLLTLQSRIEQGQFITEADLRLAHQDHIQGQLQSAWPLQADNAVKGGFSAEIQHFDFINQWFPQIDLLKAQLSHRGRISGRLAEPDIIGEGQWLVDKLSVDEIGLAIENSKLNFAHHQDSMTINGVLNNPSGSLDVAAKVFTRPYITAQFNVTGQNVTLVNNAENQVVVSPKIHGNYSQNHLTVDSTIVVDKGKLNIATLPNQAVTVSADQRIKGADNSKPSLLDYDINLSLDTGNDTQISAFGLNSKLKGHVKAELSSQKPVSANGTLNLVGGKFVAYKQVLDIEQGQINFAGPVDNPGVQFTAVRNIDDVKVGIIAQGTVAKPTLTLFSEPVMPDENILALLITGRSIESLSSSEGNALANAAIGLGVDGANKLVSRIGERLGIDNINITSKTTSDSTRIDIGADINSRLTVSYGTTIDAANNLQSGWILRYQLSENIAFEAVGGNEVGTSISYSKRFKGDP